MDKLFVGARIAAAAGPAAAVATRRKQFKAVSNELNQLFFDFPFQVPEYFALITRCGCRAAPRHDGAPRARPPTGTPAHLHPPAFGCANNRLPRDVSGRSSRWKESR